MRGESLTLAKFDKADLLTIDVGSGTGFTTQGIAETVAPEKIYCIDQSPHQMSKAQRKADLAGCHFQLGDAEDLPFSADHFDRYVSAGSIEYWPEPQRGIAEAYRVLKPGGVALMIGPLRPKNWLGRFLADTWMLFPEEEEYIRWFEAAGFENIQKRYVAPDWVLHEKYGIALAGIKPVAGEARIKLGSKKESVDEPLTVSRSLSFIKRYTVGLVAGFFFIPMAIFAYFFKPLRKLLNRNSNTFATEADPLTPQQKGSIVILTALFISILAWYVI